MSKAAPIKDKKTAVRMRQAKRHAPLPDDERGAVARELASLMPSPNYTFAAKTEVSPVNGGTEDMRYLSVLFGLIMRQRHFPTRIIHDDIEVVVAFWVDDSGQSGPERTLSHQRLSPNSTKRRLPRFAGPRHFRSRPMASRMDSSPRWISRRADAEKQTLSPPGESA